MHTDNLPAYDSCDAFTDHEDETVLWLAEGKDSDEVVTLLGCSTRTARPHIVNATKKAGAANKVLLITTAFCNGILSQKAILAILTLCSMGSIEQALRIRSTQRSPEQSAVRMASHTRRKEDGIYS